MPLFPAPPADISPLDSGGKYFDNSNGGGYCSTSDDDGGSCCHYHRDEFLINSFLDVAVKDDDDDPMMMTRSRPSLQKTLSMRSMSSSSNFKTRAQQRSNRRSTMQHNSSRTSYDNNRSTRYCGDASSITSSHSSRVEQHKRVVKGCSERNCGDCTSPGPRRRERYQRKTIEDEYDFDDDISVVSRKPEMKLSDYFSRVEQKNRMLDDVDDGSLTATTASATTASASVSTSSAIINTLNMRRNNKSSSVTVKHRNSDDEDEKEALIEELEKFKLKFAEAQSEADDYKLKYRQLHLEFKDKKAECTKLRKENKVLKRKIPRQPSSTASVISTNSAISSLTSSTKASWFSKSLFQNKKTNGSNQQILSPYEEYSNNARKEKNPKIVALDSGSEEDGETSIFWDNDTQRNRALAVSAKISTLSKANSKTARPEEFDKPLRNISFSKRNLEKQLSSLTLLHDIEDNENEAAIIAPQPTTIGEHDDDFQYELPKEDYHQCKPVRRGRQYDNSSSDENEPNHGRNFSFDSNEFNSLDLNESSDDFSD